MTGIQNATTTVETTIVPPTTVITTVQNTANSRGIETSTTSVNATNTTTSLELPSAEQPTKIRYSIKSIDMANVIFNVIANLPMIPCNAKPLHFRALRKAISDVLDRTEQNDMPFDMYVPYLLAKAQAALGPELVMPFRYAHLMIGATLEELRDFLAQNEQFLQEGVDVCPQQSRWQASRPTSSQRVAVKTAAANLQLPGPSSSRRSRSLEPRSKKKKNFNRPCYCCRSTDHKTFKCPQYLEMSYRGRNQFVSTNGICENCVDGKHPTSECTKQGCDQCNTRHNRTLCPLLVHTSH